MGAETKIATANQRDSRLKKGAIACVVLLAFDILAQLLNVWQTRHELVSPILPKILIQEINKQF